MKVGNKYKFVCKSNTESISWYRSNELNLIKNNLVPGKIYELEIVHINEYKKTIIWCLKLSKSRISLFEHTHNKNIKDAFNMYNFFYTKSELRQIKINKLLHENKKDPSS